MSKNLTLTPSFQNYQVKMIPIYEITESPPDTSEYEEHRYKIYLMDSRKAGRGWYMPQMEICVDLRGALSRLHEERQLKIILSSINPT